MKRDSKGRLLSLLSFLLWVSLWFISTSNSAELEAGFGEADITPAIGGRSVYLAGFGQNRVATKVHDPLRARAVVLRHEQHKLALVSVDLVGLFHPQVLRVRDGLPGFMHVLVSSTHNHEGPDTLGLWGPHPFKTGVDRDYLKTVEVQIIKAVQAAERTARPVRARLGTARAPELVHDSREPYVLHDELTAIEFRNFVDDRPACWCSGTVTPKRSTERTPRSAPTMLATPWGTCQASTVARWSTSLVRWADCSARWV
jgi:hypothetical protein